ncbi:hypothetical protein HK405_008465, partial [Cladochytrium tenue]
MSAPSSLSSSDGPEPQQPTRQQPQVTSTPPASMARVLREHQARVPAISKMSR